MKQVWKMCRGSFDAPKRWSLYEKLYEKVLGSFLFYTTGSVILMASP